MKIYTITLNPAYDIHAKADSFAPCHENLATVTSREAGGKGVNISRALYNAGVDNTAVIVVGTENCSDFYQDIAHLDTICIEKEGRIRENLTLHPEGAPETRISFRGFAVDDSILPAVMEKLRVDADTVVTFTGRVPDGVSMASVKAFLTDLQKQGAKIVLDSKSFTYQDICDVKPWLIKPNEEEINEYLSCRVTDLDDAEKKAKIFAQGGVENVLISMGAQGAILLTAGKCYRSAPPAITPISTIGAGDSAIAGFLSAWAKGKAPQDMLNTAVAFGTAACLTPGSRPPEAEKVNEIFIQIKK